MYLGNYEDLGNTLGDFFGQRLKPHKNVPEHFLLSHQNKKLKIIYGRIMVESDSMSGF